MHYPVPELSPAELVAGLKELLRRERTSIVETIEWLIYVNRYKHFVTEGYYSLYDYLVRAFGMTENQAFKRHTVVRQVDFFPELMQHLRSGALGLSHIVALSGHLTEANYDVIVPAVLGQTVTETKRVVQEIGLDGAPTGIELGYVLHLQISEETRARLIRVRTLLHGKRASASFEKVIDTALLDWLKKNDPLLRAQRALERHERKRLQENISEDTPDDDSRPDLFEDISEDDSRSDLFEDIAEAQDIKCTKGPMATETGANLLLPDQDEQQELIVNQIFEETKETVRPQEDLAVKRNRHIPAHLRHQVMVRDGGRCSYESPAGVRCTVRIHLEFDHKYPFSRGGAHSVSNLRLLCFVHNQLAGRQLLGRDVMHDFVRKNEPRSGSRGSPETS